MTFRSGTYGAITLEKMLIWKGLMNRKGCRSVLHILPQILLNRMTLLNGNIPPCLIEYMPCSTEENSMPFWEMAYGPNCQHPTLQEKTLPSQYRFKTISTFFVKEKRSILTSVQKFGVMCITTYWDSSPWA